MEVASIISICDPTLKANAENAIRTAFPVAKLRWRSAERVYTDLASRLHQEPEALIVSVGVMATHIIRMRGGVPTAERVVPEGTRSLLARVHGERPPRETLDLFRMLARDTCATDACAALQQAIALAEPQLVKLFGEALGTLAQLDRLPNALILIAEPELCAWLSSFFERIDFTQFTQTTLPFRSVVLDATHLDHWIGSVDDLDATLALDAAHACIDQQST